MDQNPINDPRQELVEKLKSANNILVTVSSNPSVDQLAACIGLTILLNKLKKHATAVFSGNVPSTIEFLKPDETLEKNTDSLRDFIIALDKSKADKLRYKVEENVVKIFITPYKTSISQDDLDFSQGDFNVDVVLTLGVHEQKDLDQAITAHGRILHDATVMSVNLVPGSEVGTINWLDPSASSLSELAVEIADSLGKDLMDGQIATALLTGIVAETDRFSNEKTSPNTMKLSAELMTAGANQQLVATELQAAAADEPGNDDNSDSNLSAAPLTPPKPKSDDGTLEITHSQPEPEHNQEESVESGVEPNSDASSELPESTPTDAKPDSADDDQAADNEPSSTDTEELVLPPSDSSGSRRILEPPTLGGQLTANSEPEGLEGSIDPLGVPQAETNTPLLQRDQPEETIMPLDLPEPVAPSAESTIPLPDLDQPVSDQSTDDQPLDNEAFKTEPALPLSEPTAPLGNPTTSPPPANDQIHIDADGNLQLPTPPVLTPPPQADASPVLTPMPTPALTQDITDQTLSDLEQSVQSPHLDASNVDSARDAVMDAINNMPVTASSLPPKQDVGASGYLNVQDLPDVATPSIPADDFPQPPAGSAPLPPQSPSLPVPPVLNMTNEPAPNMSPADTPLTMPLPPTFSMPPANPTPPTSSSTSDPASPPPVPPPMTELPPFSPPRP